MNITILTGYTGTCAYEEIVTENFKEYSSRYGYTFIKRFNDIPEINRFPYWIKQYLIMEYIHTCDWLMWTDADTIVTNMTIPIESIIDGKYDIIIVKEDIVQAGCVLFRNTEWTTNFLRQWWGIGDSNHEYWKRETINKDHILNDNSCLHNLIEIDNSIEDHIKYVTNKQFLVKHVHFETGDFIVHIPGSTEEDKLQFLTNFSKEVIR